MPAVISELPWGSHQHQARQYSGDTKWSERAQSVFSKQHRTQWFVKCLITGCSVVAESLVRRNKLLLRVAAQFVTRSPWSVAAVLHTMGTGGWPGLCILKPHCVETRLCSELEERLAGEEGRPFIVRSVVSIQERPLPALGVNANLNDWNSSQATARDLLRTFLRLFPKFCHSCPAACIYIERVRSDSQAPQGSPLMNSNVQKISKLITFPAPVCQIC